MSQQWVISSKNVSRSISVIASLSCAGFSFQPALVGASEGWTIQAIGLSGAEYTAKDGAQYGKTLSINESGQVLGFNRKSDRYNYILDDYENVEENAWLFDGSKTVRIGDADLSEHGFGLVQDLTGRYLLSDAGMVVGELSTFDYTVSDPIINIPWLFDGDRSILLGWLHGDPDKETYTYSSYHRSNDGGQVAGVTRQKNGGDLAWFYNGRHELRIGLLDDGHTRSDGYQDSSVFDINEVGQVAGSSERFLATNFLGQSGWLYEGGQYQRVGLIDSEHTSDDGTQNSTSEHLNNLGQAVGNSVRYLGADELGKSAWFFDGEITKRIGLVDSEHTRGDGFQYGKALPPAESGYVAGNSQRFSGDEDRGRSAWIYDGSQTTRIGFYDSLHTKDDGYQFSEVKYVSDSGYAYGESRNYYYNDWDQSSTAWFYDGNQTVSIGLDYYDFYSGISNSTIKSANKKGQVVGATTWYVYNKQGDIHWLFDPKTDAIHKIAPASNEFADTTITYFGDDGLVLGSYEFTYGGATIPHAFMYTVEGGFTDLNSLLAEGELGALGWLYLSEAIAANSSGQITGQAYTESNGYVAFLLSPNTNPLISIVSPTESTELVEGASVTFNVNATDMDGDVVKVEYYAFGDQLFASSSQAPFSIEVDNAPAGTFDITAVAYDDEGNATTSEVVTVTVESGSEGNLPPQVAIISPTDTSELIEGSPVTFTVDASDADGSVTKVEYYAFGDQLFGTVTEAPFSLSVDSAPYGTFDITVVAYDDEGASSVSQPIVINVAQPEAIVD